jgi:hypothetical protein
MADDLLHPDDRPGPAARFRVDLGGYLRGLSGPELADPLAGLPDPVTIDLIAALATRGPAHPNTELLRRRSLREVVTDRRRPERPSVSLSIQAIGPRGEGVPD